MSFLVDSCMVALGAVASVEAALQPGKTFVSAAHPTLEMPLMSRERYDELVVLIAVLIFESRLVPSAPAGYMRTLVRDLSLTNILSLLLFQRSGHLYDTGSE